MNETEIIQGARELLSDPQRWGRGEARSETGDAFCVLGSLWQTAGYYDVIDKDARSWAEDECDQAVNRIVQHLPEPYGERIDLFNDADGTTHQDILNLFDKTLADLGGLA